VTKLNTYKEQLAQVQELIKTDPNNESFFKLRDDLLEVVALTQDLVNIRTGQGNSDGQPMGGQTAEVLPPAATSASAYAVGVMVEAFFDDKWYPAVIEDITEDKYKVFFVGYGNTEELTDGNIRPIPVPANPVPKTKAVVGFKCEGQFSGDGKWYPVEIKEITKYGFKTAFPDYGSEEELPLQYLRLVEKARPKMVKLSEVTGHMEIPEHLKIVPTDTEAENLKKKKRVKAIKNHNRMNAFDVERKTKQQGWQGFQKKIGKKRVSGSMAGKFKNKQSIFASPNDVDGKVGVVGSGKGMTDFEQRKKYKLNM